MCVYPWLVCAPKCYNYALTNLLFDLCKFMWVIELLINIFSPIPELQHTLLPPKCYEPGSAPILLLLSLCSPLDSQLNPSKSLRVCHKKGDSSLVGGWWFQNIIISTRGTTWHNARFLFIVYFTVGKTCYSKMLQYCTQLDYADIGSYVHKQRQYKRKEYPVGC
jgi:hypothetical protein